VQLSGFVSGFIRAYVASDYDFFSFLDEGAAAGGAVPAVSADVALDVVFLADS